MLKFLILFFAVVIGAMVAFQKTLQNGSFLEYLDKHPDHRWVPPIAYTVGHGYYLFQNLPEATTYFLRVAQRYPSASIGESAYFQYLQCLDDMASVSREALMQGYESYLERYPKGKHADIVQKRLDGIRVGTGTL